MLIGICGMQGSGKSTLAKKLVSKLPNTIALDIDDIAHNIYENPNCYNEVIENFKDVTTNGKIDRKKLGNIVFSSPDKMELLTKCTWKYMEKIIDDFIEKNKDKNIILEWLLLHNTKFLKLCDIRILLDIDQNIRMDRILKRDNISKDRFIVRDNAALPYKNEDFNYILNNIDLDYIERIINDYEKSTISREL